jgi:Flp pilus assembly pilin Flp
MTMRNLLTRLITEDSGQDIIEYAILSALISTVGVFTWHNIGTGVNTAYGNWNTGVQDLWVPEQPIAPPPSTPAGQP